MSINQIKAITSLNFKFLLAQDPLKLQLYRCNGVSHKAFRLHYSANIFINTVTVMNIKDKFFHEYCQEPFNGPIHRDASNFHVVLQEDRRLMNALKLHLVTSFEEYYEIMRKLT